MKNLASFSLTCLLLAAVAVALPGCKLKIRVPQGGTVVSTDGAYVCESGQTCEIDIVDFFFEQTFVAEPAPGYYFGRWNKLNRYLCGGESTPCRLSSVDFEGNPAVLALLESDETFYLQPQFVLKLDCPDEGLVISPGPLSH